MKKLRSFRVCLTCAVEQAKDSINSVVSGQTHYPIACFFGVLGSLVR